MTAMFAFEAVRMICFFLETNLFSTKNRFVADITFISSTSEFIKALIDFFTFGFGGFFDFSLFLLKKQSSVKKHHKTKANPMAGKFGGGGKKCSKCDKAVFAAEGISWEKKLYHPKCFSCEYNDTCGKLVPSKANIWEGKLYCTKHFKEGGFAEEQRKVKKTTKTESKKVDKRFNKFGGGGNKCYVCDKSVFSAEQVSFEKKAYHPNCFKCKHCGHKMKNTGAEKHLPDGPDGHMDVYCKKCFKEQRLNRANVITHKDEPKEETKQESNTKLALPLQ
jgi:cysteine/glycine-rich protein